MHTYKLFAIRIRNRTVYNLLNLGTNLRNNNSTATTNSHRTARIGYRYTNGTMIGGCTGIGSNFVIEEVLCEIMVRLVF